MPGSRLALLLLAPALAGCGGSDAAPKPDRLPPGAERRPAPVVPGETVRVNLDRDPAPEELVIERVGAQVRLALRDSCSGMAASWPIGPPQDGVSRREVIHPRGRAAAPALAVETRSGAAGAAGLVSVLAYPGCAAPEALFSYSSSEPRPRPPGGRRVVDFTFDVEGSDLRLTEALAGPQEPQCCPSARRVSSYRLAPGAARYERVSSRLVRGGR